MCRLKHFRTATITHKIFETYSSFHVKQRITGKVYFLFFKGFLLVLTLFRMAGGGGWGGGKKAPLPVFPLQLLQT